MKKKPGFEMRDVCGEKVIIATGIENVDFCKMIAMNESAAYLWETLAENEFDAQTLADLLCSEYQVDKATALADANQLVEHWLECGLIED